MQESNDAPGLWRRAVRWLDSGVERELRHRRRTQRLEAHTPDTWRAVVRAAYVAVLEREPDDDGLRFHTARLQQGFPLEALLAELALARDTEETGGLARLAADADALRAEMHVLEQRVAAYEQRIHEETRAQQRTLLALTRRLAALEDRLTDDQEAPQSAAASAARH